MLCQYQKFLYNISSENFNLESCSGVEGESMVNTTTDAQQVLAGKSGRLRCKSPLCLSPCLKPQQGLGFIPAGNLEISGCFSGREKLFLPSPTFYTSPA